jgi:hypothetical protein
VEEAWGVRGSVAVGEGDSVAVGVSMTVGVASVVPVVDEAAGVRASVAVGEGDSVAVGVSMAVGVTSVVSAVDEAVGVGESVAEGASMTVGVASVVSVAEEAAGVRGSMAVGAGDNVVEGSSTRAGDGVPVVDIGTGDGDSTVASYAAGGKGHAVSTGVASVASRNVVVGVGIGSMSGASIAIVDGPAFVPNSPAGNGSGVSWGVERTDPGPEEDAGMTKVRCIRSWPIVRGAFDADAPESSSMGPEGRRVESGVLRGDG